MLRNGQWVPVLLKHGYDTGAAAAVVCRQLGYTGDRVPVAEAAGTFGPAPNTSSLVFSGCGGSEASLLACGCYDEYYRACGQVSLRSESLAALAVTCATTQSEWVGPLVGGATHSRTSTRVTLGCSTAALHVATHHSAAPGIRGAPCPQMRQQNMKGLGHLHSHVYLATLVPVRRCSCFAMLTWLHRAPLPIPL